jgi:hypothetical protein
MPRGVKGSGRPKRGKRATQARIYIKGTTKGGAQRQTGMTKVVDGKNRFQKGNAGRPPGAKERIPRSVKASVRTIIEEVALNETKTIRSAIVDGLKSGARNADRYLRIVAEYTDGKPVDTINLNAHYKEDDLTQAKRKLDAKIQRLVTAVLAKRAKNEPETPQEPQT